MPYDPDILVMQPAEAMLGSWESTYLGRLAPELQSRYATLVGARRLEWLCSRGMLLEGFRQLHGLDDAGLALGPEGQPRAAGQWHCSISHSRGLVAAAIARNALGVDIEYLLRSRPVRGLERWLDAEERDCLRHPTDVPAGIAERLALWTVKEAAAKAVGMTVWDGLAGLKARIRAEGQFGVRVTAPLPLRRWNFWRSRLFADWSCAVALAGGRTDHPPQVWLVQPDGELKPQTDIEWEKIPCVE